MKQQRQLSAVRSLPSPSGPLRPHLCVLASLSSPVYTHLFARLIPQNCRQPRPAEVYCERFGVAGRFPVHYRLPKGAAMPFRWNPREHLVLGKYVLKWLAIACPVGALIGSAVALFLWSLDEATRLRWSTDTGSGIPWLL